MRAAVLEESGKPFVVRDDVTWIGGPGPGEVRVQIVASGLCRSDLLLMEGQAPTPCVMGHEPAGVIIETGPGVTGLAVGDHVILAFVNPCGVCPDCLSGHSSLCRTDFARAYGPAMRGELPAPRLQAGTTQIFGISTVAHAEETIVRAEAAIKIPEDVPLELAALLACGVTTGVGAALNTAKVRPGSSVAVVGCGGVGVNVIQGARIAGAAAIVAIDIVENRRDDAQRFGATHAVHPDDIQAVSGELTGGAGFDYVFEVIGRSAALDTALACTRRGGTTVLVGLGDAVLNLPTQLMVAMETKILGSFYGSSDVRSDFPRLLDLWRAGRLDLESLITSRIDISEINDGYDGMRQGEGIRTVFTFS